MDDTDKRLKPMGRHDLLKIMLFKSDEGIMFQHYSPYQVLENLETGELHTLKEQELWRCLQTVRRKMKTAGDRFELNQFFMSPLLLDLEESEIDELRELFAGKQR